MSMATPILFDCDPGHDDAIALVMARRSPAIELLGVTTTCGNAEVEKTTANALRILELSAPAACRWRKAATVRWRGPWCLAQPTDRAVSRLALSAAVHNQAGQATRRRFSGEKLRASPEPILIVATGPLTNIGLMILKHRDVLPKIKELIWMGGVF